MENIPLFGWRKIRSNVSPRIHGPGTKRHVRLDRHVALKILRAECYDGSHDIFELQILEAISEISRHSSMPGRNHVLQLLDYFHHIGPNGDHVCLVFDVLGHHLGRQSLMFHRGALPVKVVKEVARQLLLGLDFLHRDCGIIHTGIIRL